MEVKKANISDNEPLDCDCHLDQFLRFHHVESDSNQQSSDKMEKYCMENADPDILLEELTEVKKDLNPLHKELP